MWMGACRRRNVLAFPPGTDDIEDTMPVAAVRDGRVNSAPGSYLPPPSVAGDLLIPRR
jgi:hypothetical protein